MNREAYLANMTLTIRSRETNDASRTTDEADGLFAHPVGHSDADTAREFATVYCAIIGFFSSLLGFSFEQVCETGEGCKG